MLMKRSSLNSEVVRSASREAGAEKARKTALKALLVFVAVMLILTLTSRALSEMSVALVSVTLPQRGTLERAVTADGTLTTGEEVPFWMGTVYRVSEIYVRVGDTIEAGDPLFAFDIDQLTTQLADAELALEKQINNRDRSLIETNASAPDTTVSDANRSLERQKENYAQTVETQERNVATAQSDLDAAKTALLKAQNDYEDEKSVQTQSVLQSAYESLTKAQQTLVNAQNSFASTQLSVQDSESKARTKLETAMASGNEAEIAQANTDLQMTLLNNAGSLTRAQQTLDNAQLEYNKAMDAYYNPDVESKLTSKQSAIESAEKDIVNKQTALDNAYRTRDNTLRDAQRTLDDSQLSYDKAVTNANIKKKNEAASAESEALNLANTDLDIDVKQKEVDALREKVAENGIVKSTLSGTVTAINLTQYATPGTNSPLLTFTDVSSGMKLSLQVTATNAEYMAIGDEATLTLAGGGFARVNIAEINAVTGNSDQKEVVVYLAPEYGTAGDRVRFRFTKRTDNYDALIPIAALRQDNTGYFVYVLRQQDGALGARTTIERVDVNVIDQDATRVAVSGGVGRNDSIIERSDRSLSDGDRVRTE